MEQLSECPVCKSRKLFKWGKKELRKRNKPHDPRDAEDQFLLAVYNRRSLVRSTYLCLSCSFLFQNPTYTQQELQALYGNDRLKIIDYYKDSGRSAKDLWDSPCARKNLEKRQSRYANEITSRGATTTLDYGGGSGINLLHPSLKHTERYVYDFGRSSLPETGILSIKNLNVGHRFDCILHTHVLEHEPHPRSSLNKLRQLITPEGFLYLEVPFDYAERILSRRPGAIWHVNHFNRKTIMEISETTGWWCESINLAMVPYSHLFQFCLIAIMRPKDGRLQKKYSARIIHIQMIYDIVRTLFAKVLPRFKKRDDWKER